MNIELIFYTQIASIFGFILALFTLYRLLVSQKDSVIELLKQRISLLEEKIKELETQSPDVLVDLLNKRVNVTKEEILRLNQDGYEHKEQISEKEAELEILSEKLNKLNDLLAENELLCPYCQAPLLRRAYHTIYGEYQGREVEAEIEYVEYECGFIRDDGAEQVSPCCSVHSS